MKISVIVPLYNCAPYVAEAIDSILMQTRPADEIIVVDDGSTDDGGKVLARYGSAVRLIVQQHSGRTTALNKGLHEAASDTIAFLDADDFWTSDKLDRQAAMLSANAAIDGVFGYVRQFADCDAIAGCIIPPEPQPGVNKNTLLIRRNAFERFGYFDESLQTSDFVPWYSRATALGLQTLMIPDVVAYRRLHATNTGIVRRQEQQQESLIGLKRGLDIRRNRGGARRRNNPPSR
jgi:glycosyltransferase involved in cell wall biosynthesis